MVQSFQVRNIPVIPPALWLHQYLSHPDSVFHSGDSRPPTSSTRQSKSVLSEKVGMRYGGCRNWNERQMLNRPIGTLWARTRDKRNVLLSKLEAQFVWEKLPTFLCACNCLFGMLSVRTTLGQCPMTLEFQIYSLDLKTLILISHFQVSSDKIKDPRNSCDTRGDESFCILGMP
jgi:hypothetical protein